MGILDSINVLKQVYSKVAKENFEKENALFRRLNEDLFTVDPLVEAVDAIRKAHGLPTSQGKTFEVKMPVTFKLLCDNPKRLGVITDISDE